jgi:hypothetical protein
MEAHRGRFVLLDVHSFPPRPGVWSHTEADTAELVMLNTDATDQSWHPFLLRHLRRNDIDAVVIGGHPVVNEIAREAHEHGAVFVALLEFNETLTQERVQHICSVFAEGLVQRLGFQL